MSGCIHLYILQSKTRNNFQNSQQNKSAHNLLNIHCNNQNHTPTLHFLHEPKT